MNHRDVCVPQRLARQKRPGISFGRENRHETHKDFKKAFEMVRGDDMRSYDAKWLVWYQIQRKAAGHVLVGGLGGDAGGELKTAAGAR